jgi:SAM-dependent methyltransferase
MRTRDIFARAAVAFRANPAHARKIDASFRFTVPGPTGGSWSIDLKRDDFALTEGPDEREVDCAITIGEAELVQVASGTFDLTSAVQRGGLKIDGRREIAVKVLPYFVAQPTASVEEQLAFAGSAYDSLLSAFRAKVDGDPAARFFLKKGYVSRPEPLYFEDEVLHGYQPDVYPLARLMAQSAAGKIVDVGCGRAGKLVAVAQDQVRVYGIDFGENIEFCRKNHPGHVWAECNLDEAEQLPLSPEELRGAILVCSDVIEHLKHPDRLLRSLRRALTSARALILSTPERDLTRGMREPGPPANTHHLREWTLGELVQLMTHHDLRPDWVGLTRAHANDNVPQTSLVMVRGQKDG